MNKMVGNAWGLACKSRRCWSHWNGRGCSRVRQVGEGREGERNEGKCTSGLSDDVMVVEVVGGIKDGAVMASFLVNLSFARTRPKSSPPLRAQRSILCETRGLHKP